jgi:hypothetical protein
MMNPHYLQETSATNSLKHTMIPHLLKDQTTLDPLLIPSHHPSHPVDTSNINSGQSRWLLQKQQQSKDPK